MTKEFSTLLNQKKRQLKKTFKTLSKETSFSQTYLKDIFSNEKPPPLTPITLLKLAKALKIEPETLINSALKDHTLYQREKLYKQLKDL